MNSQTSASDALRDSLSVGPQSSSEPRDKPEARAADQKFQYDERIAGAIIPAMLVFATMAEPAVLGMLVVRSGTACDSHYHILHDQQL